MSGSMSTCRAVVGWTRPARKYDDPSKMGFLAKRSALALAINEQPMQIDPRALGISKINRLFNVEEAQVQAEDEGLAEPLSQRLVEEVEGQAEGVDEGRAEAEAEADD